MAAYATLLRDHVTLSQFFQRRTAPFKIGVLLIAESLAESKRFM